MKHRILITCIFCITSVITISVFAQINNPIPLPDIRQWRLTIYDDAFFKGRTVAGKEALNYWMQSSNWRGNPDSKPEKFSLLERLLSNDSLIVINVNKQIQRECQAVLNDVAGWQKKMPQSRRPMIWIELALRAPNQLNSDTHRLIRETLIALDLAGKAAGYINWMHVNGANGANAHGYLIPLTLAPALINDQKVYEAGKQGLQAELSHMNETGDLAEFNLLESHWTGTSSWELMKKYIPDPHLRRMARLISERLWINRFLTWSSVVERISGPGSRMAPGEWLGADNERALFATGISKPIWVNFFFPWDGWNPKSLHSKADQTQLEATVPDLPVYLQDLALHKEMPNQLQAKVTFRYWQNYPLLPGVAQGDLMRPAKYVNYQTENYTIGSSTSSWVTNTCVLAASAWWNNSRNTQAALGSPEKFCVLYPHYVFNGMSFLDKGDIYFANKPEQPVKDEKGGSRGPWLREFVDFGRVGTLQDRNTLILSYTPKPGTHISGQDLVKTKTQRASAAMFLFRWTEGTDGLFVNREPVHSLPYQLKPGDWWFIEDGDVYAAVRPLNSTSLKGECKTILEKRTRHIVLYQDNVSANDIVDIRNEDWVKAQSGFVVEMGNRQEYGSFKSFQDKILSSKVYSDKAVNFTRQIDYQRDDRHLEMDWHCYTEAYIKRKIDGQDDPWPKFAQSPEFSITKSGEVQVKDAVVKTQAGHTLWLLSCSPSKTWVAYQPNFDQFLPIDMQCPIGHLITQKFPMGKIVFRQDNTSKVTVEIDATYQNFNKGSQYKLELQLSRNIEKVDVLINNIIIQARPEKHEGTTVWTVDPTDKVNEF